MIAFKTYLTESNREEYYRETSEMFDIDSPEIVAWFDGKENQINRFETLLNIGVQEGDKVLDFGCGVGHLLEHIKSKNLNVKYTGVDTNKQSIELAKQKFDETFLHGSTEIVMDEIYDWTLISGVFNYEFPTSLMLKTINELQSISAKGVAFNLLHGNDVSDIDYQFYSINEVKSYFGKSEIITDYDVEEDMTIYLRNTSIGNGIRKI